MASVFLDRLKVRVLFKTHALLWKSVTKCDGVVFMFSIF